LAIPGATNLIDGLSFGFNGRRALPIATHIYGFSDITRGITLNGNYFDSTQASPDTLYQAVGFMASAI